MDTIAMNVRWLLTAAFLCLALDRVPVSGQAVLEAPPQRSDSKLEPPSAAQKHRVLTAHGLTRVDEYYWLHERDNPQVIAYLNAENDYLKSEMKSTEVLQETLFNEIKARIKQTDQSVAVPKNGYEYYSRTEEGKQYPIYCRRKIVPEADGNSRPNEQILLDVNLLADGHEYCGVASVEASPNARLLAYAVDLVGRRKYTVHVLDLESARLLPDTISDVTGNLVWAEDGQTIFYGRQDPETLRSHQVYKHKLGTDAGEDVLVYEEKDEEFSCFVTKSRSHKYILIGCDQTLSSEYWYIDANAPDSKPQLFWPREENHEYSVDHLGDQFYVRTNWEAENFRLLRTKEDATDRANWQVVVPASVEEYLAGYELFDSFLAVQLRSQGLVQVRILNLDGSISHDLDFGEPCYVAYLNPIDDPSAVWLRYVYSSLTTPFSTIEYNVETREKRVLKEEDVLGGFDKYDYRSERRWAVARDGTKIPVSIVYHKETQLDGTAPCLEYGYGSYGSSMDPSFSSERLNLLNRGFVYAIAHIRGGQEMGRAWYENGKLLKKMNTFTDFIDVGKFLIGNKYAAPDKLFARGGSAGGLLIGAVVNLEPQLYHGVIADVPFVDVVTTMLDDSIPLTTSEYDEWGNPNDRAFYDYMLAYSPYDNLKEVSYPNMLVTAGLHDSQVQILGTRQMGRAASSKTPWPKSHPAADEYGCWSWRGLGPIRPLPRNGNS